MATRPLENEPLESQQVYSATYSNVPVYEFITPNGSVMRRKSDGWVNATHILKVANFPKAKRTRILEKDVQTGVHEKVQGGYGKYQGTWVPLERGLEIATEFSVDLILAPIFNFRKEEGSMSPPPAPKHHNASSKAAKLLSLNLNQRLAKAAVPNTNNKTLSAKKTASFPLSKVSKSDHQLSKLANKKRGRPPKSLLLLLSVLQENLPDYSPPPQLPPIVNSIPKPGPDRGSIQSTIYYTNENQPLYSPDRIDDQHLMHHPSSSPSDFMSDSDLAAALRSPEQSFQSNKISTGGVQRYIGDLQHQQQQQQHPSQHPQHIQHIQHMQHGRQSHDQLQIHSHSDMNSFDIKNEQDNDDEDEEDEEVHPSWYYSYRNSLLEYFHTPDDGLTDTPLPEFFTHPPPGFDINHGVDKENNTALHWACAVGDLRITDTLLKCGANANALNNDGLIPIMRSVLFTNPYERRTFAKLLELLRESLLSISHDAKTILHLIAVSTNSKIRLNAARYYMEMLLGKISAYYPRETVVNYVNKQDNDGNTALHLVSKNSVKKYLKILIAYGARIDVPNKLGERVEDYLQNELVQSGSTSSTFQETHHFQLSQPQTNNHNNHNHQQQQQQQQPGINPYYQNFNNNQHLASASLTTSVPRIMPVPHFSELAIQANQVVSNQMVEGLEDLANSYDNELQLKDEEINEIKSMMVSLTREIDDISISLQNSNEVQKLKSSREKEYEIRKTNFKKLLERSQSKDLATFVQISEQEMLQQHDGIKDENETTTPVSDETISNIISLTLYQYKRCKLVDKMLSSISSNQNFQIDKYKHLMKLCLKGSLEDNVGVGGDTDNDGDDDGDDDGEDLAGVDENEIDKVKNATSNNGGNNGFLKNLKLRFDDDDDIDEDLLLDILITNLDPF